MKNCVTPWHSLFQSERLLSLQNFNRNIGYNYMTIFWLEVPILKGLDVKPSLEEKQHGLKDSMIS